MLVLLALRVHVGTIHARNRYVSMVSGLQCKCGCRNEGREIRTPNLLIWSQTRYRCAIPPLIRAAAIMFGRVY